MKPSERRVKICNETKLLGETSSHFYPHKCIITSKGLCTAADNKKVVIRLLYSTGAQYPV